MERLGGILIDAYRLLKELHAQGYTLAVEGEHLRLTPASRLTPELRATIRAHKADLLTLLTSAKASDLIAQDTDVIATESECAATPCDTRPVWILYPNGYPEKVYTPDRIPPEATSWCREGDPAWKPLHRSESGPKESDDE